MSIATAEVVLSYDQEEFESAHHKVVIVRFKADDKYLGTATVYLARQDHGRSGHDEGTK